jgi:hypothetical protein
VKKLILSLAVLAFLGAGCSSNTGKQEETHEHGAGTHEHGSEAGHDESQPHDHAEAEAAPQQEEFTVGGDSAQAKPAAKPHQHEGQEPHTH